jgi:hypothetical protein
MGAAISSLIAWLLCVIFRPKVEQIKQLESTNLILGLTESSENALGECAKPGRLRHMRPESIKRLLDRYRCQTNEMPGEDYYETWPEQAGLICRGQYGELKQMQSKLQNIDDERGNGNDDQYLGACRT